MSGRPLRVLVIDDDPGVAESLVEYLSDFGFDAEAEGSAPCALQRLADEHFDVAIADLRLPEMSGEELIRRAGQQSPETGFLMMTGSVSYHPPADLKVAREHVFQKPLPNLQKIVEAVERLAARQGG